MKEITSKFIIISTIVAFVGMYLFFISKQGVTQQLALINAAGGGVGWAIGLWLLRKDFKKQ